MNSSFSFASLSPVQLETWIQQAQRQAEKGQMPSYIPQLQSIPRDQISLHIQAVAPSALEPIAPTSKSWAAGEASILFVLMSVVKPFLLLYLLETQQAEKIFSMVGVIPSDRSFNDLQQLHSDGGFPRNPMLNSGAIALASLLPGATAAQRCETLCRWLNQKAGCEIFLSKETLKSVQFLPNERNRSIAQCLSHAGYLKTSIALALETYEYICCLCGTTKDLAALGMLLADPQSPIAAEHRQWVTALMLTCGLYEASAQFAVEVGVPAKSGVSGALLGVIPKRGAIACYSPPLDAKGNSIAGLFLLKKLAQELQLGLFS